jgi:hypothetical protein
MLDGKCFTQVKLINLLIPPVNDPFLTPYTKNINPQMISYKKRYSILGNTR